jgi:hypothetical protein
MDEDIFGRQMNELGGRRDLDALCGVVGIFFGVSSLVSSDALTVPHRKEEKMLNELL